MLEEQLKNKQKRVRNISNAQLSAKLKNIKKTEGRSKGITLIALVVTIVVLLILAGVTINFVLGEGGILEMAKEAAKKTEEAKQKELGDFENLSGIIDEAINGEDPKTLEEALKNQKFLSFTTKYDSNGNKIEEDSEETKTTAITIPAGFKVLEGTDIEQGIVISDRDGNEFVWVPCTKDEYKMHDYSARGNKNDDGTNLEDANNGGWNTWYYTKYNDWTGDPSQEEVNEQSVEKYGGFYIARYEAGIPSNMKDVYVDSNSETKTYTDNSKKNVDTYTPVSQKGKQAWNYISQTNAKTVSEKMYAGSGSVTSRLVDGIAWDRTVEWIAEDSNLADKVKKDSTQVGNYANNSSDSKITTTSPILWAEHLYKYEQKEDNTVVDKEWCPAKNYQYNNQFTSGYSSDWTELTDAEQKYSNYVSTGFKYRHYVEMATGASDNTKLKNIYDLGGNMYEWTTERGSHKENKDNETTYDKKTHAVHRGGSFGNYGDDFPVSVRNGDYPLDFTISNVGFRVVLYVK